MLEPELLLLAFVVIFVAGATQSLTGFGFGLVAVPILTLFLSPKLAPPVVLIDGLILNLLILRKAYPLVMPSRFGLLTLAGILGVPVGTWILANWDVSSLRIYIGVITCGAALLFLSGYRHVVQNERLVSGPVGFVSGIMSGSVNMAGPPVIFFLANQNLGRDIFRANIVAYFFILQVSAIPLMLMHGIMTRQAFTTGVLLLPALIAGGLAGGVFADRVDDLMMRRMTLTIVSFAGVTSILKGVGVL